MATPPVSTANPGGILVMKSCAPTCPNSTVSSDGRALSVFCCEGNHCNRSAASGLTSSLGALWASASASLLWALLRAACKDLYLTDSLTPPPPAWALQCHVCSSSTNCKQPRTCPASSNYCKTVTTVETLTGNLVKKDCADSCTSNNSQQGQISSGSLVIQCCQGDLCNDKLYSAAPAHALFSSATLGLAVSLGLFVLTVFGL
ncbi:hypothetical protein A6R68_07187 [Neotoma lepida]|uniref:UPAR/Ly6 domain-containing protein n=1 Tax=Neotoma lepida TaxID=56216 RepID=A0A1A6GES9_NEOLE|nr:hypothetical protein A6R68_07187 [Neotoma lepida]